MRGIFATSVLLAGATIVASAVHAEPLTTGTSTPPVVQTRRALDRLSQAALAWQGQFACSGCHKQPLTLGALAIARSRGHDAPPSGTVDALIAGTLEGTSGQDANGCFSFAGGSGFTMATTYAGRGLELTERFLRSSLGGNVQAAAGCLLGRQAADGRLAADSTELPVSQGDFVTTAHAVSVWTRAFERTGSSAYQTAASRAALWLRGRITAVEAAPSSFTTQDKAMLLAGLAAAGAGTGDPDALRMRAVIASAQQGDGSWKIQTSSAGGNAFATGLAVFALRASGFDLSDPALSAGRSWLLLNQQADGSWPAVNWAGGAPSQVAPSMWGALALATFPSPLATLHVDIGTVSWSQVEGADAYDLLRGSVSSLSGSPGAVSLGPVTCLARAAVGTSAPDPVAPPTGSAWFYVFRIRWNGAPDSLGRSSDGRERSATSGDCGL
jgi:hypothetical protein